MRLANWYKLVFYCATNVKGVNRRKQIACSKLVNGGKIKIKKFFLSLAEQPRDFLIKINGW
ncbi:hypothetical protein BLD44_004775 [Mastigocladus laminosus UU774]|nr:hypothetical protein BLD44_004775 [Mastigocladus laminosus UU774]